MRKKNPPKIKRLGEGTPLSNRMEFRPSLHREVSLSVVIYKTSLAESKSSLPGKMIKGDLSQGELAAWHEILTGLGRLGISVDRERGEKAMSLTEQEKERFVEWVKSNIDASIVPEDSSNEGALIFNLVHAIRGDREKYNGSAEQDEAIAQWMLSKNQYF